MTALALAGWLTVVANAAPVDVAGKVLGEDQALLAQHRGYVSWLAAHANTAAREDAWVGLMTLLTFRDFAAPFDEALVRSPVAAHAYDTFYTHLAANPEDRTRVERLARVVMEVPENLPGRQAALTWLQANPETARRYLQDPMLVTPIPEALSPLRNAAREFPDWWGLLGEAFEAVEEAPEAYARIVPWWRQALKVDDDHTAAYTNLVLHFAAYPNRFWVWHRREVALAEDAQARNWIRYWHRLLRRSEVDLRAYYQALRGMDVMAIAATYEEGERAWPPKTDPPALGPLRKFQTRDTTRPVEPTRPGVERPATRGPARPSIAYPDRPAAPQRPARPTVKEATPRSAPSGIAP